MKTGYPPREEAGQSFALFCLCFFVVGGVPEGKSGREGAREQRRMDKTSKVKGVCSFIKHRGNTTGAQKKNAVVKLKI